MNLGGIFFAQRSVIAFGTELLWLIFSVLLLCAVGSAPLHSHTPASVMDQAALIVTVYLLIFYLMDLYRRDLLVPGWSLLLNLASAAGLGCIIIGAFEFGTDLLRLNPLLTLAHAILTVAFVICWRTALEQSDIARPPKQHVGIVASEHSRKALQVENERRGPNGIGMDWLGGSLLQAQNALETISPRKARMHRLVIEPEMLDDLQAVSFLRRCRMSGLLVEDLRSFAERTYGKVLLEAPTAGGLIASRSFGPSTIDRLVRYVRDTILACIALVLTVPVSMLIALAIKLESSGPVLFCQERIGENGRRFVMFKFRSMYQNAGLVADRAWTTHHDDPRITRVGRIIRLLHIDEIPQLVNVIRGEMSLVGPRPFHPQQVAELESRFPLFGLRHLVRPGITGWAQITCDYDASVTQSAEVFARDLYYVKHRGFLFDLLIMLNTIKLCLWRRGAR